MDFQVAARGIVVADRLLHRPQHLSLPPLLAVACLEAVTQQAVTMYVKAVLAVGMGVVLAVPEPKSAAPFPPPAPSPALRQ